MLIRLIWNERNLRSKRRKGLEKRQRLVKTGPLLVLGEHAIGVLGDDADEAGPDRCERCAVQAFDGLIAVVVDLHYEDAGQSQDRSS